MPQSKNLFKLIINEIIYGGHLQSLAAVSVVFISAVFLSVRINWQILLLTYFIFYSLYAFNRYKEINTDYLTNKKRTEHLKLYAKRIPFILFLVFFIIISILIYLGNYYFFLFIVTLLLFGFLYNFIAKENTKKVPLLKDFYVSCFFAAVTLFPSFYYRFPLKSIFTINAIFLIVFVYFKTFLMQIFLDIKDVRTDKRRGLITLPVLIGKKKTLNLLIFLNSVMVLVVLFSSYFFGIPAFSKKIVLFLFFVLLFNFYCIKLAKEKKYLSYILSSGEFTFWAFLVIINKIISLCL